MGLQITGDDRHGYILVMSPDGFFTADCWYESRDAALGDALELFGVSPQQWVESP